MLPKRMKTLWTFIPTVLRVYQWAGFAFFALQLFKLDSTIILVRKTALWVVCFTFFTG